MIQLEDIKIDEEFRDFLPTVEDASLLRGKIELEGWSDEPITVWENHNILLDGHRRYDIWKERGDDGPQIRLMKFANREAALHWVSRNQRARRNLTPEQERYLVGYQYKTEVKCPGGDGSNQHTKKKEQRDQSGHVAASPNKTRSKVAKESGTSEGTVARSVRYADAVDDLDKRGVVSKSEILSGAVKVPASKVIEASKAESNEEAKDVITSSQKGANKKNGQDTNPSKASAKEGSPKQREIAVYAIHDVTDYLKRSPLVRLGVSNPFREYAYKQVIGWLKSNMKDKTHGTKADETDD